MTDDNAYPVRVEEIHFRFFIDYYFQSLEERNYLFNQMKFYFSVSILILGYLGWFVNQCKDNELLLEYKFLFMVFFAFSVIISFLSGFCIFQGLKNFGPPKEYCEMPNASELLKYLNDKEIKYESKKISAVLCKDLAQCAEKNSNINDMTKNKISEMRKYFVINSCVIFLSYMSVLILTFIK